MLNAARVPLENPRKLVVPKRDVSREESAVLSGTADSSPMKLARNDKGEVAFGEITTQ